MGRRSSATKWILLLPAVLFIGLHARSLDYPFVWTDGGEIVAGGMIVPVDQVPAVFSRPMLNPEMVGSGQSYYRPVHVAVVSLIDHHLGRTPRSFRGVSLALGIATTVLFSFFASWLFGRWELGLLAGTIAASHPVLIQNHVWIAGANQAISTPLVLANIWTGCIAMRHLSEGRSARGYAWTACSTACLAVALLAKESAAVAPGLLLVCWLADSLRRSTPSAGARFRIAQLLPGREIAIVLVQVAVVLWFAVVLRPNVTGGVLAGIPPLGGSMKLQALTAIGSWPASMGWLIAPLETSTSDVVRIVFSYRDPSVLLSVALLGLSLLAWPVLMLRGHVVAALGIAWIWIAFAPTSGLVPLTHMRATRYLHFSMYGAALLVPALVAMALSNQSERRRRFAVLTLTALTAVGLGWRHWERVTDWQTGVMLFRADVERDPLYREGYHQLAVELAEVGRLREAKAALDELAIVGPAFKGHTSYLNTANAQALHCNLAIQLGLPDENLPRMAGLTPDSGDLPRAPFVFYQCAARTFEALGRYEEALAVLEVLVELGPSAHLPRYLVTGAHCLARLGRTREARAWLAEVPRSALANPGLFDEITAVRAML